MKKDGGFFTLKSHYNVTKLLFHVK